MRQLIQRKLGNAANIPNDSVRRVNRWSFSRLSKVTVEYTEQYHSRIVLKILERFIV